MKIKDSNIRYVVKDLLRAFVLIWKADKRAAFINIILQFIQALLPVVSLYFIKALIEALVKGDRQFEEIIALIIAFGLVQFFLVLAAHYAAYINTIYQETLTNYLSAEVLKKAGEVDYAYYENPVYHDTLHLAQLQSLYKAPGLLANLNALLLNSMSLMLLVAYFSSLHSLFALLFIGLSIPLAVIKWYSGFALVRLDRQFAAEEREAGYLHHTLTNVSYAKEVRAFGFGNAFIQKFNKIRSNIHHVKKHLHIKLTWYSLIAEGVGIIAMVFIFGLLAKYAWEKTITIGVFVIYLQGFQYLQNTSKSFLQAVVQAFQQRLFLQDLFTFFDIEVNKDSLGHIPFPNNENGLMVQNISFTYPQTTKEVLHNVSIKCSPGRIIAIVGENGSGKSTLVKLLARLYSLQSGSIKIGDDNISDILIDDFRSQSIFLFQDFEKYFLTIEENIALGENKKPETPDAIQNAAILSGAHDFITKLSKGYQTRMGRVFEGSEQISGGQWQKLTLARLFYKETKLVVLDEPTSALDATAEFELFKNVKKELKDKMVILVTHRLYNLKIADHIYVMQDGRITEEGSFEDLINKNGAFTQMYNTQKL
jgi:ATP-binding cassette subfamily B protein